LEVHDHPSPYPLGWIKNDVEIKVMRQCKIKFAVSANFINEVELVVVPLSVCVVAFGIHYMYMRDGIFMRRENYYRLIKHVKYFIINAHKGKSNISLLSANHAKFLISSCKKLF
jgi:hypothetical protein